MPTLRSKDPIVAIACSDLHLSLRPPAARSGEPNWLVAMLRPIAHLTQMAKDNQCPVLCAGDIFDRWNSPPELINWAIHNLPFMFAIPGQHDMPMHNIREMNKSAFTTLEKAGTIERIQYGTKRTILTPPSCRCLFLYGFPWGSPIRFIGDKDDNILHIALIHRYTWVTGHSYPGADKADHLNGLEKSLTGFDVAVIGDNHKGFVTKCGDTTVLNCGGLMRRRVDEAHNRPMIGLIHSSGKVRVQELDTSHEVLDVTLSSDEDEYHGRPDFNTFLAELGKLAATSLDFAEEIKRAMETNKVSEAIRGTLLKAMQDGDFH